MSNSVPTPKPRRGPKPGTKGKAPSLESQTGKLFLATFLLPAENYPLRLQNMTRGAAINLSVGLNRINKEYWKLEGENADPTQPKWVAYLSAKAKAVSGEDESRAARAACRAGLPVPPCGDWYVEISESYLRTGNPSPARKKTVDWLDGLLAQVEADTKEVREKQAKEEAERTERLRLGKLEKEQAPYRQYMGEGEAAPTRPVPAAPADALSDALSKHGYGLEPNTTPETAIPHSAPARPWLMNGGACTPLQQEDKTVMLTKAEVEARLAAEGKKP